MQYALQLCLPLALVVLSVIDIRSHRLPDVGTYFIIACGLAYAFLDGGPSALGWSVLSAAVAYLAFAGTALAYRQVRGRDGLGMGDAKLLAGAGAWLGWVWLAPVVFISALSALSLVVVLQGVGRTLSWDTRLAFGPFLAFGFYVCWLLKLNGLIQ